MSTELKQGSPEWFEAREGRITGSRVGAILGVSPYKTKQATLRDMVAEALGERDDFDNPAMKWGRDNEDKARHIYEFLYIGIDKVEQTGFWTHHKFLGASPDGLVGDDGLVEIKCPYGLRDEPHPHFDSVDDLPHYYHQIQLQLLCTDRQWCDLFQWSPHGHRCERVYREKDWLLKHDETFCEFVDLYRQAVENAAQGGPEERVGLSARWNAAVEAYQLAKRTMEAAKDDMDEARNILIDLCEDNEIDQCKGGGLTVMKVLSQGRVDYKLMAQDNLPNFKDVTEEYRKEPSVSWRVTEDKS